MDYTKSIPEWLWAQGIRAEKTGSDELEFSAGEKLWPLRADLISSEPGGSYIRLTYRGELEFRSRELPEALLVCNRLNAGGRCGQWAVGDDGKLCVNAHAELTEKTASMSFSGLLRGMTLSLDLGLPELEAVKHGLPGSTGTAYAAAFESAWEKSAPPACEASVLADELEEYLKTTGYAAGREDARTLKVRLEDDVFASVRFGGSGDVRMECGVRPSGEKEKTARTLITCNMLNAVYQDTIYIISDTGGVRDFHAAYYVSGTGEIRQSLDEFVQRGSVGEMCVRQLDWMREARESALAGLLRF